MLPPALSKADLHLLYVFCTVVKARGFSAAQITLNVSASTISRQIADLETRLGMRLCQRGRKGFRLTDKGEIVYAASHKLFAALDQFGETVDGTRGKLVGRLSVAAIDNWVFNNEAPIMGALGEFTRIAPQVEVEIHSLAPDDIEMAVQDALIALGVGVFHKHKPGLIYETLGFERIGLYCSRGHPLFTADTPAQVEDFLPQANFCKRAYLNEDLVAPVSRGLPSNASAHQIEGIAMLVLTGRYIGYLPESFANIWVREGRVRSVGDGMFDLKSEIKLVRKRGVEPNLVVKTFIKLVKKSCGPLRQENSQIS
ncbi:LysR family transcriptional regulator [Leisingera sp. HS039]|uniref:LysR family transcriptional regulator n=1 Tax=unclassified Leisingera TaxID=2614906 RepID=UPI001071504D|nr:MULTISPECIES: LysR family transcriptional regulator [unclassified Leisingera]MBQ4826609.1 LysR family transcriptional regulator [Leisingera sp. HS039]QBR34933.1 LysR family transcriptional regulator [Leisingera sp. NJS201]